MYDDKHQTQKAKSTKRTRVTIKVSPELQQRIKIAASQNHILVSEYLRRILEKAVPNEASMARQEKCLITPEFLEQVYRVRERISRESGGYIFEDSAERVRQQREERTRYLEELLRPSEQDNN